NNVLASGPMDSTLTIMPATSGTFHVQVGNGSRCRVQDSIAVVVSLPNPAIVGDSLLCADEQAVLTLIGVDPGSIIQWTPATEILTGQGTMQVTVWPPETMTYGVTVTAPSGCTWSGHTQVQVSAISSS